MECSLSSSVLPGSEGEGRKKKDRNWGEGVCNLTAKLSRVLPLSSQEPPGTATGAVLGLRSPSCVGPGGPGGGDGAGQGS